MTIETEQIPLARIQENGHINFRGGKKKKNHDYYELWKKQRIQYWCSLSVSAMNIIAPL